MRKRFKGRKLSRKVGPRKELLKTLANSFFVHEKIETTEAKAKELRPIAEKMITRAKNVSVANRRILAKYLNDKTVKKLVTEIAPRYKERNGGYSRIIKLGPRSSDGAKIAVIELIK